MLRFHQVAADPAQVAHAFSGTEPSVSEMVRYLRGSGLRARTVSSSAQHVVTTPLPAIAMMADGACVVLAKATAERVLILDATMQQPRILPMADFSTIWTGQLVLATKRASLSDLGRRFDIGWFLGAIHKYRRILIEVLAASLFLQIFALLSPLLFQVVIDKVLVHRGLSTLDVIIVGLVTIALFETALGFLRTYIFAHTTNRIDVELGARLFRHLLALPLPYFQARRVGDSVARVRELENIRNFLTSSALTLVIDLLFTTRSSSATSLRRTTRSPMPWWRRACRARRSASATRKWRPPRRNGKPFPTPSTRASWNTSSATRQRWGRA